MGRFRPVFLVIVAMVLVLGSFASAQEAVQPEFTLKAQGSGPVGVPEFDALYLGFKDKVEERSGGRIKVDFYPSQSFAPDREYLEMMQQGIVDIFMGSDLTMGLFDPKWNIMYLPFIFDSREQMYEFLEGPPGQALAQDLLDSYGIRVFTWADSGHRSFSNNKRPIRVPDDVKGLRIRSPETRPLEDWMRSLGIDPVVLSLPEMAPALQQGVVDGQDIELFSARMLRLHELQKYWNNLVHLYVPIPVSISEKTWQRLPDDLKQIVEQAAIEAALDQRQALDKAYEGLPAWAKEQGLVLVEVTPEEKELWIASAKPFWDDYVDLIGEDMMDLAFDFLGKSWRQ